MPRLLVFNRSYPPDVGATGRLLAELCEDLTRRFGWAVTVVAGPTAGASSPVTVSGPGHSTGRTRGVTVLRAWGTRRRTFVT